MLAILAIKELFEGLGQLSDLGISVWDKGEPLYHDGMNEMRRCMNKEYSFRMHYTGHSDTPYSVDFVQERFKRIVEDDK